MRSRTKAKAFSGAVIAILSAGAARSAAADTIWVEAEEPSLITNPLLIKDAAAASSGRFLEVPSGSNRTSAPATSGDVAGQACYSFFVEAAGDYKIWTRIIAASTSDDSFYARIDGGSWLTWNQMALGSDWHWDLLHTSPTAPIVRRFEAASDHVLCVAYREDGAKLDTFVVTNDASFVPPAPSQRIAPPARVQVVPGKTKALVQWTPAPGATKYTVRRSIEPDCETNPNSFMTRATGITGHSFQDILLIEGPNYCYKVWAESPTSGFRESQIITFVNARNPYVHVTESDVFTITKPLTFVGSLPNGVEVNGFATPLDKKRTSPPTGPIDGIARYDFQLPEAMEVKIWAKVAFKDTGSDSFFYRIDRGPWVTWNGWKPVGCSWDGLHDSSVSTFDLNFKLAIGTHTLEFAYREPGAGIDRLYISDDRTNPPGGCFD